MNEFLTNLPFILVVFFLAGTVKGVVGLGLPTVAMGLLGLVMGTAQGATLLLLPSLVTNLWQLAAGSRPWRMLGRLRGLLLGIMAGTWAGSGLMAQAGSLTRLGLGLTLIAYGILGLFHFHPDLSRLKGWKADLAGAVAGMATGAVTGATGLFVVPAVPYLGSLGLARDDLVQALGLSFTVSTLALGAGLAWHGQLAPDNLGFSLLALVPALLGMAWGTRLRMRLDPVVFRRCFFLGLLVLGGELVLRAAKV